MGQGKGAFPVLVDHACGRVHLDDGVDGLYEIPRPTVLACERDHARQPWTYTHTVGFAENTISLNVLFFWVSILFVFWLTSLGTKKEAAVATVLVSTLTQPSVLRP